MASALEMVNSVPYNVSLRWVFYQMVQHFGFSKKDYNTFKSVATRFRKRRWGGWKANTLKDDTRPIHDFNTSEDTPASWINGVKRHGFTCNLDKHIGQERVVKIWFEAQAMFDQFRYYTEPFYVSLVPFRGDASIHLKWRLAKELQDYRLNRTPVTVLYYGDFDMKGVQIAESAVRDIREWSHIEPCELLRIAPEFEFIRVGLNAEHIDRYDMPENPDSPGNYQWEALNDEGAEELIVGTLGKYLDLEKIRRVKATEYELMDSLQKHLTNWDIAVEGETRYD